MAIDNLPESPDSSGRAMSQTWNEGAVTKASHICNDYDVTASSWTRADGCLGDLHGSGFSFYVARGN
jgi:hypothetical protein